MQVRETGQAESNLLELTVTTGDAILEAFRRILPGASTGKILIQRDELSPTKNAQLFYAKLPPGLARKDHVLLVDPMVATAGSVITAIRCLIAAGCREEQIVFVNLVSCPEGLRRLHAAYPKVQVVTAAVDPELNASSYIVPGLGDMGDRYFGTTDTHADM